jgi:hypothetical protein
MARPQVADEGDRLQGYRVAVNSCISSGGHPKSCGLPAGRVAGQGYSKGVSISVWLVNDSSGHINEPTTEVRNLLTNWIQVKFRRKNLLHGLFAWSRGTSSEVGVGLAAWGTTSVRFPAATETFLFTITCRLAGTHSPSKLMREVTLFPRLKRPVHETITHLYPVSRLRILGYDPPFLPCCA